MSETEKPAVGQSALLPNPQVLVDVFKRRFWSFLVTFALILAAAIAYLMWAPRYYTATAELQVLPSPVDPVTSPTTGAVEVSRSTDFIDTQVVLLQSPQLLERVAKALKLDEDPTLSARKLPATLLQLNAATSAHRVATTQLVDIDVTTRDRKMSVRIANEFAKQYLQMLDEQKLASKASMDEQIDSRLSKLRGEAEAADAALQHYNIQHGLLSAQGATMAEQEASSLNGQIAQARADLAERQGRLSAAKRQLAQGSGGSDTMTALTSGTIGALRQQEADSSRTLAQLRSRYGPKHPAVGQEEQRLADVRRQIQLEIDRIMSSLQAEVQVASSRLSSLLSSEAQSHGRLAGNAEAQVGFMELDRKASAARTIYESFLNRSRGAAARDGIEQPIATLTAPVALPLRASSPKSGLIVVLGALFALLGGFAAVAVAEFLDRGIKSRHDVEKRLGARYLGTIPELRSTLGGLRLTETPENYILSHPMSAFAESLRNLRAAMTLRGRRAPKVLVISSALPQEGKTTTAVCLARTLALSGARTVFVDCDIRRHAASDTLLAGREGGLLELLRVKKSLDQVLLDDLDSDLKILCTHEMAPDATDLLTPEVIGSVFDELRSRFDFVVVDTPPVLAVADAQAVASKADAVVLLARWRRTSMGAADAALDLLIGAGANIVGVVLSQVDVKKFGSSQQDYYAYHKLFKGYYQN
ncbi:MAG: polysaccharide biosynthesis tyrosine autokinase [Novosphingobium sp.]